MFIKIIIIMIVLMIVFGIYNVVEYFNGYRRNCPYHRNCPYRGNCPYKGNCPYHRNCPYKQNCPYYRRMQEDFFIQETKPYWKNIGGRVFPVQEGFSNRPTNECYMNCPYPNPYGQPCYNSRCCVKGGGNTVML